MGKLFSLVCLEGVLTAFRLPQVARRIQKPDKVRSEVKKSEEKLHLNPTWVEGMMGFPHGWTDLGNEESPE